MRHNIKLLQRFQSHHFEQIASAELMRKLSLTVYKHIYLRLFETQGC